VRLEGREWRMLVSTAQMGADHCRVIHPERPPAHASLGSQVATRNGDRSRIARRASGMAKDWSLQGHLFVTSELFTQQVDMIGRNDLQLRFAVQKPNKPGRYLAYEETNQSRALNLFGRLTSAMTTAATRPTPASPQLTTRSPLEYQ
jgi:hypothetical protein